MSNLLMHPDVVRAREFAFEKHKDMTVSDGKPYSVHLQRVVDNLFKFVKRPTKEQVMACYLHDTVEDTDSTLMEIEAYFGSKVRDIVYRVTDEPGKNRKERKEKTYPKISNDLDSTLVKLCDRIANVEYPSPKKSSYCEMYKKEQPLFESICRVNRQDPQWKEAELMWEHLSEALQS